LAGTEDAQVPAVSPDGQWVAFWAAETLKKVALVGGPVVDVARRIRVAPVGVSWDDHGNLFFGKTVDRHIWKVSAEGTLMAVTTGAETDWAQILPSPLPGGRALLYTVRKREWSWGDEEIVAQTLATGTRKVLLSDAADARYLPSGHLVFLRRGTLFAVAFDPERLELRSTPQAVQGVWRRRSRGVPATR
jgi:serine/threonine-protein kinase